MDEWLAEFVGGPQDGATEVRQGPISDLQVAMTQWLTVTEAEGDQLPNFRIGVYRVWAIRGLRVKLLWREP